MNYTLSAHPSNDIPALERDYCCAEAVLSKNASEKDE